MKIHKTKEKAFQKPR